MPCFFARSAGPFPKPRDWPVDVDPPELLLRTDLNIGPADFASPTFFPMLQADAQEEGVTIKLRGRASAQGSTAGQTVSWKKGVKCIAMA